MGRAVDAYGEGEQGLMLPSLRAAMVLRRQGMPLAEIRAVLTTDDRAVVRRYLELHSERLDEGFTAHRRNLARVERAITARGGADGDAETGPIRCVDGLHRRS
jgi:hypothetical protein